MEWIKDVEIYALSLHNKEMKKQFINLIDAWILLLQEKKGNERRDTNTPRQMEAKGISITDM